MGTGMSQESPAGDGYVIGSTEIRGTDLELWLDGLGRGGGAVDAWI